MLALIADGPFFATTQDKWTPIQIAKMQAGGNAKAREFFEQGEGYGGKAMPIADKVGLLVPPARNLGHSELTHSLAHHSTRPTLRPSTRRSSLQTWQARRGRRRPRLRRPRRCASRVRGV